MKHMKNRLIIPALLFVTPVFTSVNASAFMQRQGSVQQLINACNQELRTLCNRARDPREAYLCLRENEHQLQTAECNEEMRLLNREVYNVPLPTEQPFQDTRTIQ